MQLNNIPLKKKLIYLIIFAAIVPLLITVLFDLYRVKNDLRAERQQQIIRLANLLDLRLESTFSEILEKKGASKLSRKEQVAVLNRELQPLVDDITQAFPGAGAGYYSAELDSVVAFGPNLTPDKLIPLPQSHPGREMYKTGTPVLFEISAKYFRGQPLMAYNLPIYRNGRLIGHTWGNVLINDIDAVFWKDIGVKLLFLTLAVLMGLLWVKKINNFISESLSYFTTQVLSPHQEAIGGNTVFSELVPVYTAVRRTQRAIMDDKKFLETLLDTVSAGIICVNKNGSIVLFNKAMESMGLGKLHKYRGKSIVTFLADSGIARETCPIIQALETRNSIPSALIPRAGEKGLKWLSANATVLLDSAGKFKGVLGTFHDVTEIKELESQVVDIERFKVVGELAAAISHEVRNPLTTVKGFLQLFLRKSALSKQDRELYELMIDEIDRANEIIGDFLSISRQPRRANELISINTALRELMLIFRSRAVMQDINILTELRETPPVKGDKSQLKQVFLNLFNNAVDAMPQGGTLTVKTWFNERKMSVDISIKDTGHGISREVLERLGRPFVTTKEKGTGLGLSVCYRIIENHFGQISVSSSPENGTDFIISLPASNNDKAYLAMESSPITKSGYSVILTKPQLSQKELDGS